MNRIALLVSFGLAIAAANAQPGTRNAIVYGARAAGERPWHFGSLSLLVGQNLPAVFEIGAFCFRAQGVGHSTAVYKTYIDGVVNDNVTDTIQIIDDPTNGIAADGRVSVYNVGAQTQNVFTNRGSGVGGSGYRISSSADTADSSAAGGISVKQAMPIGNPGFHQGDGELTFRFNVTVSNLLTGSRYFTITTRMSHRQLRLSGWRLGADSH